MEIRFNFQIIFPTGLFWLKISHLATLKSGQDPLVSMVVTLVHLVILVTPATMVTMVTLVTMVTMVLSNGGINFLISSAAGINANREEVNTLIQLERLNQINKYSRIQNSGLPTFSYHDGTKTFPNASQMLDWKWGAICVLWVRNVRLSFLLNVLFVRLFFMTLRILSGVSMKKRWEVGT